MDDLISRQSAIDAVSRGCEEFRGIFAECEKNLNELPSTEPEPQWIPCSERLPEVSKEPYYVDPISGEILFASERVLVFGNNENGYDNAVASHIYSTDVGDEWSGAYDAAEMELTQILAWMPLPEPYRLNEANEVKEGD